MQNLRVMAHCQCQTFTASQETDEALKNVLTMFITEIEMHCPRTAIWQIFQ